MSASSPAVLDLWPYAPELIPLMSGISIILQRRAGDLKLLNVVLMELTAQIDEQGPVPSDDLRAMVRNFLKERFPMRSAPQLSHAEINGTAVKRIQARLASFPPPIAEAVCMYYLDGSDVHKITHATGVTTDDLKNIREILGREYSGVAV